LQEDVIVVACLCFETYAAGARVERVADGKTLVKVLAWECETCEVEYRFAVPEGGHYTDVEAMTLRLGPKPVTDPQAIADYARRLREADPRARRWLRLARLLRAWREKAGLTQEAAAARAGISARDYKRLEEGRARRRLVNVEKAVRGVVGVEEQMRLLVAPGDSRAEGFDARMKRADRQRSGLLLVLTPVEDALMPAGMREDAAAAAAALGRALVSNAMSEPFLFYAQVIFEIYWCRRLGGFARPDELTTAAVRPVKELIDLYKACESVREKGALLDVVRLELEAFLTQEQLYEAAALFFGLAYEEAHADGQVAGKLGLKPFEGLSNYYTPAEALLLATFDRAGPERRRALLDALRRIDAWDRRKTK
jgi:transcriptional regulator with XRE-family HTH domain